MFYSQMPKALIEELAHMSQACAITDLTMGAGTWAVVALEQGLPYFGVALTELHYQDKSWPLNIIEWSAPMKAESLRTKQNTPRHCMERVL